MDGEIGFKPRDEPESLPTRRVTKAQKEPVPDQEGTHTKIVAAGSKLESHEKQVHWIRQI